MPPEPPDEPPRPEVMGLFPTPFMRVRRLLDGGLVEAIVAEATARRLQTNAKSTQLSHTELVDPAQNPHYRAVGDLAIPYLASFGELLFGERLGWSVKEIWVNVLETGGRQAVHAHANSFVSGVVYLTQPHPSANTVFIRAMGGAGFIFSNHHKGSASNPFNGEKWVMPEAGPGDLILFPSYLLHEVPPNQGERRITLAFNAIPDRLDNFGYAVRFSA